MASPFRVLQVGCGSISSAWLKAAALFPDDISFVGFVDLSLEAAQKRAAESGTTAPFTGTDVAKALAETRPEVVFDCTVPAAHEAVTCAALAAGAHVLGEKPMASSIDEARRMIAAAAKRHYAITQTRRAHGSLRAVAAAVASGAIGRLHTINADFYMGPHFGGFREEMAHVLLLDMAIHSFDQARCLAAKNATHVYCHEYNPPGSWFRHGASAMAIFEMEGGAVFNYRGSWCAEGERTSWECGWRLIGDKGTLQWDGASSIQLSLPSAEEGFLRPFETTTIPPLDLGQKGSGHAGIMGDFFRALRTGGTPETAAARNFGSLAMVLAAVESARAGQRIAVPAI
ncbi:MAG: Gfo/Idh/MocA family oxidoreductase [Opitutales bacterium]|nr:Gfo/Idh/MocA family oxidoreductase [Opitutales bacterium]